MTCPIKIMKDIVLLKYWLISVLDVEDELSESTKTALARIKDRLEGAGNLSEAEENLLELLYEDYC